MEKYIADLIEEESDAIAHPSGKPTAKGHPRHGGGSWARRPARGIGLDRGLVYRPEVQAWFGGT